MVGDISLLSWLAAALYFAVVLSCAAASFTAVKFRQPRWNRNVWLTMVLLFGVLIAMRTYGVEDFLRESLRDILRGGSYYALRRGIQSVAVSSVLAVSGAIGAWWFYRVCQTIRGRRNLASIAALAGGAAMTFLLVVRVISLHRIDGLLYGPLKLNWVGDIGTSLIVLCAAAYYTKLVMARP